MPIENDLDALSLTSGRTSSPKPKKEEVTTDHGITTLPVTYIPHKQHVQKSKAIMGFEREGSCSICRQDLIHDKGIYAICPHPGCESVSHLTCLSKNFLEGETGRHGSSGELSKRDQGLALVPTAGKCKSCGRTMRWVDIVKEVTLRMRGAKEVEGLLKEPRKKVPKKPTQRKRKLKGTITATNAITSPDTDEGQADNPDDDTAEDLDDPRDEDLHDKREDFDVTKDDARFATHNGPSNGQEEWHDIDNSDGSVTDTLHATGNPDKVGHARPMAMDSLTKGSDWDDVPVLD